MKRIIIICEGQTEKEFCDLVLSNYFIEKNIYLHSPLIGKSGGIISWNNLKKEIEIYLKQDRSAYVTTFIDLYGLPSDYPNYNIKDPDKMQMAMKLGIDSTLSSRFIPYIQRHEFECFMFASMNVLKNTFREDKNNFPEIEKIITKYSSNLEDINDGYITAPSKRLKKYLPEYQKGIDGAYIADEIGLSILRTKCPRFSNWIKLLEQI